MYSAVSAWIRTTDWQTLSTVCGTLCTAATAPAANNMQQIQTAMTMAGILRSFNAVPLPERVNMEALLSGFLRKKIERDRIPGYVVIQ